MKRLQGTGASKGLTAGPLSIQRCKKPVISRETADPRREKRRFEAAREQVMTELEGLYRTAEEKAGKENAAIFAIHRMLLEDEGYLTAIRAGLEQGSAEWAVDEAGRALAERFSQMKDPYMQARGADVQDVTLRLLHYLAGEQKEALSLDTPVILAAEDFTPSDTLRLEPDKILALLTAGGSVHSHTVILARAMGIPAVVGLGQEVLQLSQNSQILVDGEAGTVCAEPDAAALRAFAEKREEEKRQRKQLEALKGLFPVTKSGKRIQVCANISSLREAGQVVAQGGEGVGLFRTEFLYMAASDYPKEEELFGVYRKVLEQMQGRKVVFRTLDIGADKQAEYFALPKEANPALGLRGIRLCLERPELFRVQLRALYRASAYGPMGILFPMITAEWELKAAVKQCRQVQEELRREGHPFAEQTELGAMIETPAAALLSGKLAGYVSFFSIGTNDLAQYTLAVDRQQGGLQRYGDPHHPAVLELIRQTVEHAHREGIRCGICGELAADLSLTETFIGYGVDELSVSLPAILPLRDRIRKIMN